ESKSRTRTRTKREQAKQEAPADKPLASPDLRILETQVLKGPNYWSYQPCIRLLVDLGSLENWPSNTLPGFNDQLLDLLPGLKDGTWMGHVAEHVALELQREAGLHVPRGKTRSAGKPGQYNVIYGYGEETVGLAAGRLAVRLVNHLVQPEEGFDFLVEIERL